MRNVRGVSRGTVNVVIKSTIVILLAAGLYGYRGPLAHALTLATSHQPETFTELAFANVTHLPTRVTAGKQYPYSVQLISHESAAKTYTVTATVAVTGSQTPVVTTHIVTLQPGTRATEQFSLSLPDVQQSAQITVSISPDQLIYFRSNS